MAEQTTTTPETTMTDETTTVNEVTTTAVTNIASDEELIDWAINDYKDKTGSIAKTEIVKISDNEYKVTLSDDKGNVLDVYTIDTVTGVGTNSKNQTVELPQTENGSIIASDEELINWAEDDYKNKIDAINNGEIVKISDNEYQITISDDNGNVLDVYTIDPVTGVGTNADNETVELPQTGNNSMTNRIMILGAFMLIGLGVFTIKKSGVIRRKED